MIELFPAIDLRGGKVVRLLQGDFGAETVYGDDPIEVARQFHQQGARWVHVVDLDGAKTGDPANRKIIAEIARTVPMSVQTGGGMRDRAAVEAMLSEGVARVVLGTLATESPDLVTAIAAAHPGCVAVGLDARDGIVAIRGWVNGAGVEVVEMIRRYEDAELAAFVVTDIDRDGMLGGPDVRGLQMLAENTRTNVIASGGVSSLGDLEALTRSGVSGVIVGKALYENRFTVEDALAVCGGGR